jgi:hypothetical protein
MQYVGRSGAIGMGNVLASPAQFLPAVSSLASCSRDRGDHGEQQSAPLTRTGAGRQKRER